MAVLANVIGVLLKSVSFMSQRSSKHYHEMHHSTHEVAIEMRPSGSAAADL